MTDGATRQPDDATIVLLMMDGHQDGLRALLRVHGPYVKGFLRKRWSGHLDDHELAAVFYRAAWKVWRFAHRYDDRIKSLRAWFALIAHREASTARSASIKKAPGTLDHDPGYDPGAERDAAETAADPQSPQSARLRDLDQIIDTLPPLQQRIVRADLADPTGQADSACISRLWGNPINSIEVSRNKARKKIESEMRARGHYQNIEQRTTR